MIGRKKISVWATPSHAGDPNALDVAQVAPGAADTEEGESLMEGLDPRGAFPVDSPG